MRMYELPDVTQKAIKDTLLVHLDKYINSGDLPKAMKISQVTIDQGIITVEIANMLDGDKLATVEMDEAYQVRKVELIEDDDSLFLLQDESLP